MLTFIFYILLKYYINKLQYYINSISLIIIIKFDYNRQINYSLEFIIKSTLLLLNFVKKKPTKVFSSAFSST